MTIDETVLASSNFDAILDQRSHPMFTPYRDLSS